MEWKPIICSSLKRFQNPNKFNNWPLGNSSTFLNFYGNTITNCHINFECLKNRQEIIKVECSLVGNVYYNLQYICIMTHVKFTGSFLLHILYIYIYVPISSLVNRKKLLYKCTTLYRDFYSLHNFFVSTFALKSKFTQSETEVIYIIIA